ncbi:hypothetical protein Taro_053534, partial [Colocasia esculenta]|nr:hypothetical protein [Colocasia esculenta]
MIKYLDDIERIRSYAWAVAFHELILHNIEEASKMVKMNAKRGRHDEKPRKNQFIFGCSYALCVESKLSIHPSEQWVLEGKRGNANLGDFAPAEVPPSDPPCEAVEKENFEEEMIDCDVQLLEESCSLSDYKKWEYLLTLIVSSIHTGKHALISQKAQRLFESFPAATNLEYLGKLDFFFLHTTNHWHLLVVDLKNRCFISYNSIKGNKSYDAAVRN